MEKCIVLVFMFSVITATPAGHSRRLWILNNTPCAATRDVTKEYQAAVEEFVITLYKKSIALNNFHFVFAGLTIWIVLAAIAEGVNHQTQQELFKLLQLPNDPCVRQQYYKLATFRFWPGDDIRFASSRALVIDEGLTINPHWHNFISRNSMIDVISAPIKTNPEVTLNEMRRVISAKLPNINLSGNSVLLEAMDLSGLWTTAFSDAIVERAPFKAPNGQKLGYVDLMKMRKYVRMGYVPNLQAKALELPVGVDSRYSIIFAIVVGDGDSFKLLKNLWGSILNEVLDSLQESAIPINVAIPKYTITSELDVKAVLEGIGVNSLWNDSSVTRPIAKPALLPSSYVHRGTISISSAGVYPMPSLRAAPADAPTGLDPRVGRDFIADQPFMFGLFDKETYTCIVAAAFSQPTYIH